MASEPAPCPECGRPLLATATGGARRYQCENCRSAVIGVAVLRGLLAEGEAQRLWTSARPAMESSSSAPGSARCPFCSRPMMDASRDRGPMGVCRSCEMVWLTEAAMQGLPAAPNSPTLASQPVLLRCDNCGAPLTDSPDGRCHYCHRDVVAPQIVIVATGQSSAAAGVNEVGWAARSLAGSLLEVLFGATGH